MTTEAVQALELRLHGMRVGYLAGYQSGRNVLVFDDDYRNKTERPTLTLSTHPHFPRARHVLQSPWIRQQRLHPVLSNLLPEGALKEWVAAALKIHPDNEFPLLAQLGQDLPGALIAVPLTADEIPEHLLTHRTSVTPIRRTVPRNQGFSLAGVQMKFSMREREGRFHFTHADDALGDWIIKTPSTRHRSVPANEFSMMRLAAAAGVDIPETRLIDLASLEQLPSTIRTDETCAYAIKRFDRYDGLRRHTEDMAQVLFRYPHEKYHSANHEQIGRLLRDYTQDGLANMQQFARRLLVNILLANGDAHLKNWSLIYPDQRTPVLAPAYDIVMTRAYIEGEHELALNLNGRKDWYRLNQHDFKAWANALDVPWRIIKTLLDDTLERARDQWPRLLAESPMEPAHQKILRAHWRQLANEWRIDG